MKKPAVPIDLILLFVAVIWGLNFTVIKTGLAEMNPWVFNSIRYSWAILTMWFMVLRGNHSIKIAKEDWKPIIWFSLLGHIFYQLLFIWGINFTKAANTAVFMGTIPIWVAILSHFFFKNPLSKKNSIGVATGFLGLALMIGANPEGLQFSSYGLIGDILVLFAAFSFGLFTLFTNKYLVKYNTTVLTTVSMTVGGIWVVLAGIPSILTTDFSTISWVAWAGTFYSGILAIAISYFIWNYGMIIVGAVRTAAYQNLAPVIGVAIGVLVLNEQLNWLQFVGAGIAITGVFFARSK